MRRLQVEKLGMGGVAYALNVRFQLISKNLRRYQFFPAQLLEDPSNIWANAGKRDVDRLLFPVFVIHVAKGPLIERPRWC